MKDLTLAIKRQASAGAVKCRLRLDESPDHAKMLVWRFISAAVCHLWPGSSVGRAAD